MNQFPMGALPSPHDYRDYPASKVIPMGSFPEEYCPNKLPVKNQGNVGACVAFTISLIKEYQERKERSRYTKYSPAFVYNNRGENDYQGEGMYPREALKRLREYGVCDYDLIPDIKPYPQQKSLISKEVLENAKPQKVATYAAVNTTEEVKNAIYFNGPVLIVIPIYQSFLFYQKANPNFEPNIVLPLPQSHEKQSGYHAVAIIGYTKDYYIIQNSWGELWGDDGFCKLPFNYPITEKWAITDYTPEHDVLEIYIDKDYRIFNGKIDQIDAKPFVKGGRTFTPTRHTHEAFGDIVIWDEQERKVTIKRAKVGGD